MTRLGFSKTTCRPSKTQAGIDLLRQRGAPAWVRTLAGEIAGTREVSLALLLMKCRRREIVRARNELIYQIKSTKPQISYSKIARWIGKDLTSALYAAARHAEDAGLPSVGRYDLKRRRSGMSVRFARRSQ